MAGEISQEALSRAENLLAEVSDAPELDARWLAERVESDEALFWELVEERKTGKPLAYILGEWEFFGRRFFVNEDVLVPRPETEVLVEKALEYIDKSAGINTIADIGTGSGCVAITLALELQKPAPAPSLVREGYHIHATDISEKALAVAKKNAKRHGVLDQIDFRHESIEETLKRKDIDFIVSNPPYVPTDELAQAGCARDTRGLLFEPKIALDGGADGRKFIKKIEDSGIPAICETINGDLTFFNI